MNTQNTQKIPVCVFGDKLILAFDKKYLDLNNGKPLEFNIEFQKKELVLRASFDHESQSTDELGKFTDER